MSTAVNVWRASGASRARSSSVARVRRSILGSVAAPTPSSVSAPILALVSVLILGWSPAVRPALSSAGPELSSADSPPAAEVRPPAAAGRFYPEDAAKLRSLIQADLGSAVAPLGVHPLAIVAPHAGYIYSGQIAADAYRQVSGSSPDLVVILGTNHTTAGFRGISVYPRGAYRTPLGLARIDEEVAGALRDADPDVNFVPAVHEREHSVEVQIPFVQSLFPEAEIVPVVVGAPDLALCTRFGTALAGVLRGRHALIVASSDLSHYPPYDQAEEVDRKTLASIASLDPARFHAVARSQLELGVPGLATCACGEAPILAAMVAAKTLGATRGIVVAYANSGDSAAGDRSQVVGYGAVVFTDSSPGAPSGPEQRSTGEIPSRGAIEKVRILAANDGIRRPAPNEEVLTPAVSGEDRTHAKGEESRAAGVGDAEAVPEEGPGEAGPELREEQKRELLELARTTIERYLSRETTPTARAEEPALQVKRGAFVTLTKHGQLRGCIGHMVADTPLDQVVRRMAVQAAFADPRFPPVTAEEVPQLEIEISVLTPYSPVAGADDIVLGRDGVLLRKSGRSAVFLPQVAPEQGWSLPEMLDHLCLKAGLPAGSWKQGAELFVFQAEVFSEHEFDLPAVSTRPPR